MNSERDHAEFRELAPELALGIADGEARARALEHLAGCPDCRRYLEQISASADELLLLAPSVEPPPGFESRVVAEIAPAPRRARRWRRPLALAATAIVSGAVVAAAMFAIFHDDRELASSYRRTLSEANGSYFAATSLRAPGGRAVGDVFRYEGHPSFVLVSVDGRRGRVPDGTYDCRLIAGDGATTSFGTLEVRDGRGSYGTTVDASLDGFRQVSLVGPGSGTVLSAPLGSG